MPKAATLKDALYALEFGKEELIGTHVQRGMGGKTLWHLSGSGMAVDAKTASLVQQNPAVIRCAPPDGANVAVRWN
jgi:hypothetical protein